jgi:hypothetical protein
VLALLLLVLSLGACLRPAPGPWGHALSDEDRAQALAALPQDSTSSLVPLSEIFYARVTRRRFNSRATFEDPSLRQFFVSVAAFSDYYAALADALDRAHIRYNRPYEVTLVGIEPMGEDSIRLRVRFVGRNDLPLRWWSASLERTDQWRWEDGRWWVIPGKV